MLTRQLAARSARCASAWQRPHRMEQLIRTAPPAPAFQPTLLHAGGGRRSPPAGRSLQQFEAMAEGEPVNEDCRDGIDKGQRQVNAVGNFWIAPYSNTYNRTRVQRCRSVTRDWPRHHLPCGNASKCANGAEQQHPGGRLRISAIRCGGVPVRRLMISAAIAYRTPRPTPGRSPSSNRYPPRLACHGR